MNGELHQRIAPRCRGGKGAAEQCVWQSTVAPQGARLPTTEQGLRTGQSFISGNNISEKMLMIVA